MNNVNDSVTGPDNRSLEVLFNFNPIPMWAADPATYRIVAVNDAAIRDYGYSREEFLSMRVGDWRAAGQEKAARDATGRLREPGDRQIFEAVHRRKDGHHITVEMTIYLATFASRPAVVGFARDLASRFANERSLAENMMTFRAMFVANPMPMWLTDRATLKFLEVNDAALELYGYKREEFLALDFTQIRPPEDVPKLHAALKDLDADGNAQGGDSGVPETWRHLRKNGTLLEVHVLSQAFNFNGRETWLVAIEDLTDVRRAQRRSEFLLEAGTILTGSLDLKTTLESLAHLAVPNFADWCTIDFSEDGLKVLRRTELHADPTKLALLHELSENYLYRLRPDHPILLALHEGKATFRPRVSEEVLSNNAHDPRHIELRRLLGFNSLIVVPLLARGRSRGAMGFVRGPSRPEFTRDDLELILQLADRAALAIDNSLLYEQSLRSIRVRDEFMSVASHELKTPLTALLGYLQFMQLQARKLGKMPSEADYGEMLGNAEAQGARMAKLVNNLLDVASIRSGKMKLNTERLDLAEVCRNVIRNLTASLHESGCAISLSAPAPVPGVWDRLRIEQVVTNLVSNAAKYGRKKPIEISVSERDGRARIVVRDLGIGIPPELRERIFERFERLVSASEYAGLGLGLFIVRQIVDAHGGKITVDSAEGQGSVFTVELPSGQKM